MSESDPVLMLHAHGVRASVFDEGDGCLKLKMDFDPEFSAMAEQVAALEVEKAALESALARATAERDSAKREEDDADEHRRRACAQRDEAMQSHKTQCAVLVDTDRRLASALKALGVTQSDWLLRGEDPPATSIPAAEPRAEMPGMPTWESMRDRYMFTMLRDARASDSFLARRDEAWIDVHAWLLQRLSANRPSVDAVAGYLDDVCGTDASWKDRAEHICSMFPVSADSAQAAMDKAAMDQVERAYNAHPGLYGCNLYSACAAALRSASRLQEPRP